MEVEGIRRGLIKVNGKGLWKVTNKTDNYVTVHDLPTGKTRYPLYRVFPEREREWPGRGVDHPHPSSAEVEGRVEL